MAFDPAFNPGTMLVDPHAPHPYADDYGRSKHCTICGDSKDSHLHAVTVLAGQGYASSKGPELTDPWKHRSRGMQCRTCMWYVPKEAQPVKESKVGRCRRHAPTMNGYPVVFVNDWCGDHKLNENEA